LKVIHHARRSYDRIKELVNNGLASGNPLLLAAVAPDSKPVLSFRGSKQAYSDGELGLWNRNMSGDTIEAIKGNPHVAMMYRSATTPLFQFHGRARITTDEAERERVFEARRSASRNRTPSARVSRSSLTSPKLEAC
jgi:hypothetical protein